MASSETAMAKEAEEQQRPEEVPEQQEEGEEEEGGYPFSLDIGLLRTGDEGSAFHTSNDPNDPRQRETWTARKSAAIDIRVVCLDVVHGLLAPDSTVFATLLVLEFRFDPRKLGRRIASADIELLFSADSAAGGEPVVAAIAPVGRLSLERTTRDISSTVGAKVKVGSSAAPVDVGVGGKWERTVEETRGDATTVIGSADIVGRTWGKPNSASWTLLENPITKNGVPASMRTAVLLHRTDEERFRCVLSLRAKADWKSEMAAMRGSTPPDDPVLFDPTMPSTNRLQKYVELELGAVNLEALSDITFATVVENATKRK